MLILRGILNLKELVNKSMPETQAVLENGETDSKKSREFEVRENFNFRNYRVERITVLLLASGHLFHAFGISWLCFLAGWAENLAKLCMQLPISAMRH